MPIEVESALQRLVALRFWKRFIDRAVRFIVVYCHSNSIKGAPMPDVGNEQLRSWMFVPGNRDRFI